MGAKKRPRRRFLPTPYDLHEDVMVEIMSRLPAKSLLRFKCVSKRWKSIIEDPTFITLHHKRALSRPNGRSLMIMFHCIFELCVFSAPYHGGAALPLLQYRHELMSYGASPSTHGLILLFRRSGWPVVINRPVFVYNPSTWKLIRLPPLLNNVKDLEKTRRENPKDDICLFEHDYSLGFDPLTGVYKVLSRCNFIRYDSSRDPWEQIGCSMYYVLTLGTKEWRKLDTPQLPSHKLDSNSACVNGVIYFKADHKNVSHDIDFVVTFNVGEEKFGVVSPPQATKEYQLLELGGRLVLRANTNDKIVLWILEDQNQDKWTLFELEKPLEWIHGDKPYTLVGGVLQSSNKLLFAPRHLNAAEHHWFYYYDQSAKEWSKFLITGLPADIGNWISTLSLTMNNTETLFSPSAHLQ